MPSVSVLGSKPFLNSDDHTYCATPGGVASYGVPDRYAVGGTPVEIYMVSADRGGDHKSYRGSLKKRGVASGPGAHHQDVGILHHLRRERRRSGILHFPKTFNPTFQKRYLIVSYNFESMLHISYN